MTVLALHGGDLLAIAAVLLVWVGLRRIRAGSRRGGTGDGE